MEVARFLARSSVATPLPSQKGLRPTEYSPLAGFAAASRDPTSLTKRIKTLFLATSARLSKKVATPLPSQRFVGCFNRQRDTVGI